VRLGVHLPQYGHASGPDEIHRAARQAEDLGFSDVWVYDHLAVPASMSYPVAFTYEPLITLTWAAAVTNRVGLGTSILVLPYRHPVTLAKMIASIDRLSGGRMILGAGCGWLREEFDVLGVPFEQRGALTDEAIDFLRACWEGTQPMSFEGPSLKVEEMKIVPQPAHRIPIWVGGTSAAALRRAATRGDGWQGAFVDAAQVPELVKRLRELRSPERDPLALSMRVEWDGLEVPAAELQQRAHELAQAGIEHLMVAPSQRDIDSWCRSVDALWGALSAVG